jgi:hypothetical protein
MMGKFFAFDSKYCFASRSLGSGLAGEEVLGNGGAGQLLAINRDKYSSALRGRWFTTRCSACPASLKATVTTTLRCTPRTSVGVVLEEAVVAARPV